MKAFVTGNLGYNGPVVVRRLRKAGIHVVGFDSEYYDAKLFPDQDFLADEQIIGDLRNISEKQLDGIDIVVHLAGLSNDALGELNPKLTQEINFTSSIRLARMAKAAGAKRFIFASSCSVYGIADPALYASEASPVNPLTEYAKAKVMVENELLKLRSDGFGVVNLRNATMHGAAPRMRLDLVLNNLVASAYLYNKVKILSDGTPWRPLLSVDDFAEFVCLFSGRDAGETAYNVGFTSENFRVKEIGSMISDATGAALEINPVKTPDERSYRVSFSKLEKESGRGAPLLGTKESIKRMWDAFDASHLSEEDFKSSKYFRIRKLKEHLSSGKLDGELFWSGGKNKHEQTETG